MLTAALCSALKMPAGAQPGRLIQPSPDAPLTTRGRDQTGRLREDQGRSSRSGGYDGTENAVLGESGANFRNLDRKICTNRPSLPIGSPTFTVPNALVVLSYHWRRGKEDHR